MLLEGTRRCALVVALSAAEMLLSGVFSHVFLEDTCCCTCIVAFSAAGMLLSNMCFSD